MHHKIASLNVPDTILAILTSTPPSPCITCPKLFTGFVSGGVVLDKSAFALNSLTLPLSTLVANLSMPTAAPEMESSPLNCLNWFIDFCTPTMFPLSLLSPPITPSQVGNLRFVSVFPSFVKADSMPLAIIETNLLFLTLSIKPPNAILNLSNDTDRLSMVLVAPLLVPTLCNPSANFTKPFARPVIIGIRTLAISS